MTTEFEKFCQRHHLTNSEAARLFGVTAVCVLFWRRGYGTNGAPLRPNGPAIRLMAAIDDGFDIRKWAREKAAAEAEAKDAA